MINRQVSLFIKICLNEKLRYEKLLLKFLNTRLDGIINNNRVIIYNIITSFVKFEFCHQNGARRDKKRDLF